MATAAKPKIYVESSTVSYLTALATEEPIRKAKQILTKRWWTLRDSFDLYISQTVVDEIGRGDQTAADLRIDVVKGIPLVAPNPDVDRLAHALLSSMAFPQNAEADAFHVALAAVHGMDFVLTWNQRHIASLSKRAQIEAIITGFGFSPPRLLTPEQLLIEMGEDYVH